MVYLENLLHLNLHFQDLTQIFFPLWNLDWSLLTLFQCCFPKHFYCASHNTTMIKFKTTHVHIPSICFYVTRGKNSFPFFLHHITNYILICASNNKYFKCPGISIVLILVGLHKLVNCLNFSRIILKIS